MEDKTQKRPEPKIVRTLHFECRLTVTAVLIIFPVIPRQSLISECGILEDIGA